jgi:hypothetical protein
MGFSRYLITMMIIMPFYAFLFLFACGLYARTSPTGDTSSSRYNWLHDSRARGKSFVSEELVVERLFWVDALLVVPVQTPSKEIGEIVELGHTRTISCNALTGIVNTILERAARQPVLLDLTNYGLCMFSVGRDIVVGK